LPFLPVLALFASLCPSRKADCFGKVSWHQIAREFFAQWAEIVKERDFQLRGFAVLPALPPLDTMRVSANTRISGCNVPHGN
jgi:hypothetical protein